MRHEDIGPFELSGLVRLVAIVVGKTTVNP